MKVYLVRGQIGCYSDRYDFTVCAYRNKQDAGDHATNGEVWFSQNTPDDPYEYMDGDKYEGWFNKCPYCDGLPFWAYGGPSFWVEAVEVR